MEKTINKRLLTKVTERFIICVFWRNLRMALPVKTIEKLTALRGRNFTDKQLKFLQAYSESLDVNTAVTTAGYTAKDKSELVRSLKKEMLEIIELKLVEDAGKAAETLYRFLESDDPIVQGNLKLEAAKTVLDRVGLGKREQVEVHHQGSLGLFILPAKEDGTVIDG